MVDLHLNFKIILYLILFYFVVSCGVKGPPVAPAGTSIPALIEKYMPTPTPMPSEENSRT